MIKATGITAEYNPLHNGHVYQMEQAREQSGSEAVVVAMSGDFVQRGGPAILDKWTRTGLALSAGADLVVEIPVLFCLGNAAQYASASVNMLEALGCSHIAFGSECGDSEIIARVAAFIRGNRSRLDTGIAAMIKEGLSYPAAREAAYADLNRSMGNEVSEAELAILKEPNDILALEYMLAMKSAEPVCVRRAGAGHDSSYVQDAVFQSASAIRDRLKHDGNADAIRSAVPDAVADALENGKLSFTADWTDIVRYAVLSSSEEAMEDCPSGGEGLSAALKEAVMSEDSLEKIIMKVKSKRYTYTRISRLCMQTVLGISRTAYPYDAPAYVRVLGFSERGRDLLSEIKKSGACPLPVITNINRQSGLLDDQAKNMLALDVHAADVYNLVTGRDLKSCSDHVMTPVMI